MRFRLDVATKRGVVLNGVLTRSAGSGPSMSIPAKKN